MSENDLGPLPMVNPRSEAARRASLDLDKFVLDLQQRYDLTYAELFHVLASALQSWAITAVRQERQSVAEGE